MCADHLNRTVFVIDDEGLLQVVLKSDSASLPFTSNSDGPTDTSFGEWFTQTSANRIASDINQDITTSLFRVNIYSDSSTAEGIYFVLSISHALYDGMAIPPLMRDVDSLFSGLALSSEQGLDAINLEPPVPLSSVLTYLPSSNDASAREFWTNHLKDVSTSPSTIRRPTPEEEVKSARTKRVLEMGYGGVKDVCMKMRVTPQAVFAAAFAVAGADSRQGEGVGRWREDAVFGVSHDNSLYLAACRKLTHGLTPSFIRDSRSSVPVATSHSNPSTVHSVLSSPLCPSTSRFSLPTSTHTKYSRPSRTI